MNLRRFRIINFLTVYSGTDSIIGCGAHWDEAYSDGKTTHHIDLTLSILFHTLVVTIPISSRWFKKYQTPDNHNDGLSWSVMLTLTYKTDVNLILGWWRRNIIKPILYYKLVNQTDDETLFTYKFYDIKRQIDVTFDVHIRTYHYNHNIFPSLKKERSHAMCESNHDIYSTSFETTNEIYGGIYDVEEYTKDRLRIMVGRVYEGLSQSDILTTIRNNKINNLI